MNCDRAREELAEYLAGGLDAGARGDLASHLELCSSCRAEFAAFQRLWNGLDALPSIQPGPSTRPRFLRMLEVYQAGQSAGVAERASEAARPRQSWSLWSARPAWQAMFAAVLAVAGFLGGRYAYKPPDRPSEIAQLQGQVENLRQLVAMSLMREASPSARLRGVTYTYQMTQPDAQVEQALLYAVNHDPNVNVRLSAVDALQKFASEPAVRRAMTDALSAQDSPLVQAALIDGLAQWNDTSALPALRRLAQDSGIEPVVRQRAASALQNMEISK
jgi:anti-sigma-K factor RskA